MWGDLGWPDLEVFGRLMKGRVGCMKVDASMGREVESICINSRVQVRPDTVPATPAAQVVADMVPPLLA